MMNISAAADSKSTQIPLHWAADCLQITDLLDVVLDSFIKTSATGGLGSIKAEVMADTAVALASGNVKLVSSKVRLSLRPL